MFSLVICTYGRTLFLQQCFSSVVQAVEASELQPPEVIIVNNNDQPDLIDGVSDIIANFKFFKEVRVAVPNLSSARNRGAEFASFPYVIYLDDDTLIDQHFLAEANFMINHYPFDCFGGVYTAWHLETVPKWLPDDFSCMRPFLAERGTFTPGVEGMLVGCIFAVKRDALFAIGGFDTNYGLSDKLGTGEDDDLQLRLHAAGYQVGFSPFWTMQHVVLPHKYSLWWQLRAVYTQGRDGHRICPKYSRRQTFWHFFRVTFISGPLKRLPIGCYHLLTKTDYFWQSFLLEYATPIARCLGRLRANIPIR